MPGSADLHMAPVPPARPSNPTAVYFYDPYFDLPESEGQEFTLLPHVRLEQVTRQAGPGPWTATFRYVFDSEALAYFFPDIPRRVEQVFGPSSTSAWSVNIGARLVAYEYAASGTRMVFDGYVDGEEASLNSAEEVALLRATAHPIRCWDSVIDRAYYRNSNAHQETTELPHRVYGAGAFRLNPDGIGNCSLEGYDQEAPAGLAGMPVFIDRLAPRANRRLWDLDAAVRAILFSFHRGSDRITLDSLNVPAPLAISQILSEWEINDGFGEIDYDDPESYTRTSPVVPDVDLTGMPWPDAIWSLLTPHGFTFRWELTVDAAGRPEWHIVFDRLKDTGAAKVLKLQRPGSYYDPRATNVGSLSLSRDVPLENAWGSLTDPYLVECSVILAPLFEIDPADADPANLSKWREGEEDFESGKKYRRWGLAEGGEPHHTLAPGATAWSETTSTEATPLLPLFDFPPEAKMPPPASLIRARPGRSDLVTRDETTGERLKSYLEISTNYPTKGGTGDWASAKAPAVGMGMATELAKWQRVTGGGWKLLEDGLGIELTDADLEEWSIGKPEADAIDPPFPSGVVRVVSGTAAPDTEEGKPLFVLRLTTVIEGNAGVGQADATYQEPPDYAPNAFKVERFDETRDRFVVEVVHRSSDHFEIPDADEERPPFGENFNAIRDDREKLAAHLKSRQSPYLALPAIGTASIPLLTHAYRLGDRIRAVEGRDISLRGDNAADEIPEPPTDPEAPPEPPPKETRSYPVVSGIAWNYGSEQSTTLYLSNARRNGAPR